MTTVYLAIYDTMADWEAGYAVAHINSPEFQRKPGRYQVATVGRTSDAIVTKGGLRILPDIPIADVELDESALLILPGADIALEGGINEFAKLARRFLGADVPVAAICGATAALAREGLFDEMPHTSNAREFLESTGYRGGEFYVDQPAVTAGRLITASGIAPVAFATEIFRMLDLYDEPTLDAWSRLYGAQDPSGFYALMARHG